MQENNSKRKELLYCVYFIYVLGVYILNNRNVLNIIFAEMKPPGTPPLATPLKVITQLPVGPCQ